MTDLTPQAAGADDDPKKLRSGYFEGIAETMEHVRSAIASEGKRLRTSDVLSIVLLPIFALLLAIFAANIMLTPYRPLFAVLFFFALLYFIGGRIGVLRALTPRQTHLLFNIILASFMLGCTMALLIFEVMRYLASQ
jgi:uncharacterized membrane protein